MAGTDFYITLAIDTEILKPEWAAEIARFWSSKDEVLAASDGDDYQAVARYAAPWLWCELMEWDSAERAVEELHKEEGWCIPTERLGINIIDYELPDMTSAYLEVEVLA
jgi:hypothetical protein